MRHFPQAESWWIIPPGPRNAITDVEGVTVGHATLLEGTARTGVTAILPHGGDLFRLRPPAGAAVLNGFGKSLGLIQVAELGEIETPILLTNTFGVHACASALIRRAITANPAIGRRDSTVNPLVFECNDGQINDIQAMAVGEDLATAAIGHASTDVAQGTIGAGTGMKTFGLAGGIGSASRRIRLPGKSQFMLGALVLSNFGQASEFRIFGQRVGKQVPPPAEEKDKGSIIVVYATDAPMESRQLTRLARRASAALGRLGSHLGHGSGDIALAFSTANCRNMSSKQDVVSATRLPEQHMNIFFHAAVEAAEEAVLNALWNAETIEGYSGRKLPTLRDQLEAGGTPSLAS
ncbi:DmpA family aminopeptidase [Rhizobium sp. PAMB 3174]